MPVQLRGVEPQPDPGLAAVLRNVKVRRRQLLQDVVHLRRSLARDRNAAVAVMVDHEPAEAFPAYLDTGVAAEWLELTLRQGFDDLRDALALHVSARRLA